ncbi:MAG: MFS transporter [Actinomycetia bacterium]|nr:MFS transporter [Actinomycetes bacterium]
MSPGSSSLTDREPAGDEAEGTVGDPSTPTGSVNPSAIERVFGSTGFFRLWLAQVLSATGDWLGLVAITALAARIGGGSAGVAIGFVLSARIAPGFFLGPVAGVIVDRAWRQRLLVFCDIGRALVLAALPFVDTIAGLVVASFILEVFTLLWAPAKEASVPHLVPQDRLTQANSLSLVAAYGTFPIGIGLFALFAKAGDWLEEGGFAELINADQVGLALYADSLTFLAAAAIIASLTLPHRPRVERKHAGGGWASVRGGIRDTFNELGEGLRFIVSDPVVRAVNASLSTGLVGGAMLVPLGPIFLDEVVGAGPSGFGLAMFSLGMGVAAGVAVLSLFQNRIPKVRVFVGCVFGAGLALLFAASSTTLGPVIAGVSLLGVCAGGVYVLGFTLLQEQVADEFRGRIFSALYTVVRLSVLVAFAIGPFLSQALGEVSDALFDGTVSPLGFAIAIPGVRLTLWLGAVIIVAAGFVAMWSLRAGRPSRSAS